ncbi:MAG: HAMP domain-containing histidine kinase [Flammeovirgaceae bacterium]|nr:HAMP domain-containing histidine kinase [Flammeovirgaceae bacterium]
MEYPPLKATFTRLFFSPFRISHFVLSPQEYKRVILTSQLSLIFVVALICFTVLDIFSDYYEPLPFNLIGIAIGLIVIYLNSKGHFMTARVTLAIGVNVITIFFTATLVREMGVYIFSICINIGVFVAFGYERIRYSWMIVTVSTLAFVAAVFHPYERLTGDFVTKEYVDKNLLTIFLIASFSAVVIVYYMLRLNHRFESKLMKREKDIEFRNQELLKVNAELDKFFYSASHDMRAPLTSIKGLIQLMEMSDDVKELKEYAAMLKGRADNLDQFIKSISEYAANSRQPLNFQMLNLKSVLKENLENFKFYPGANNVRVILDVPGDSMISADAVRLQVIFGNIISNAFKYHDYSKPNPFLKISGVVENSGIRICFEDNGSGIREEYLSKIFTMFYRANTQVEGAGLGLFIVREAIDKLHGSIEVSSVYGEGTTFVVTLPLQQP